MVEKETKGLTDPEEFPEHDEELLRRGEEARLAELKLKEDAFEDDYTIFKKAGEQLNMALDVSEADFRAGFGSMNHRLNVLNEQFLNVLWGGHQLTSKQAFNKNSGTLWAQPHTTLNAPDPMKRFNQI